MQQVALSALDEYLLRAEDDQLTDRLAEQRRAALRRSAAPSRRVTRYLTIEQALRIASTAVGEPIEVRDVGLLESAIRRPRARVLGQDAYPDLLTKDAALLHSLARNHPLADGNTRLAWLATWVFLAKNGTVLDPDDDAAYELVVSVAACEIEDVAPIAQPLPSFSAGLPG
jgi:death-on-curing protein